MSDKTEEPTDSKLREARKKGQVPARKNILEAILLSSGVILVFAFFGSISMEIGDVFDQAIIGLDADFEASVERSSDEAVGALANAWIFMGILAFLILFSGLLLNKFNFAPESMTPKFEKLNPVNGLKGIFSKSTLYNFIRLLIYFTALSVIGYFAVSTAIPDVVNASYCGLSCLAGIFVDLIKVTVVQIIIILTIMAAIDFKIQTALFRKQNMMTKDEVKKEGKQQEGDPMVKGARQNIAMEDAFMPGPKDVTHVIYSNKSLVAVMFNKDGKAPPFVVMKASGGSVSKLQQRFRRMGVKTVNLPTVAQQFHKMGKIGSYLPAASAKGMFKVMEITGEQMEGAD